MQNTTIKGKKLEDEVADIYRELEGTIKVEQNINIAGIQVDVYVEVMSNDGIINKYAIDSKNFNKDVNSQCVRDCITNFIVMKQSNRIDQGIIVSATGFTADADTAAKETNIRLVSIKDLRRRVLDFSPYLNKWIETYEKEDLKRMPKYLPLTAKNEEQEDIGQLDNYLLNWLNYNGVHITLLGNFGTGKSTTLRRLMWTQAKRYLENPDEERIPIFVELKGFRQAPKSRQLITDILVNDFDMNIRFSKFQDLNQKGRFLIILDGFDEMVDRVFDGQIQEHFNELSTLACKNSKVILSCRTHYFKDHEHVLDIHKQKTELYDEVEGRTGFQILFLNSFKENDINDYLKAYFYGEWEFYKEIIKKTYDLYSLAEIPILLNMIVETLPEMKEEGKKINRPAIYETFTNKWLKRDGWRRALHTKDRLFFCEQLALHFYISQENSVHWSALPRYIKEYFSKIDTHTDLDVFDSDVRTSNFLKRKENSGEYSFVHKSFMEYFAASYFHKSIKAKRVNGLDQLKDYVKSKVIYDFLQDMIDNQDVEIMKRGILATINNPKEQIFSNSQSIGNCAYFLINKGISMKNASLDAAILSGFSFNNVVFEKASLNGADFKGCKLANINFKDAILAYSNFENAKLRNVDFSQSTLGKANFLNVDIDSKTMDSIAKSKFWGTAKFSDVVRQKLDRLYKINSSIISYNEQ